MWMAFPHCAMLQSRAQGSVTSRGPKDGECVAGEKPAFGFRMEKDMSIRHVNKKEMSHTGKATGVVAPDLGLTSGGLSRQVSSILILKDLGLNASLFK